MAQECTSATGALVISSASFPTEVVETADWSAFFWVKPTFSSTNAHVTLYIPGLLRLQMARNAAQASNVTANNITVELRDTGDTHASPIKAGQSAVGLWSSGITPQDEWFGIGLSWNAASNTLTLMAKSENVALATDSDVITWSPVTSGAAITIADPGTGVLAMQGMFGLMAFRDHVMSSAEFEAIFDSGGYYEFVTKTGGNFTGPAGVTWMTNHKIATQQTIGGTTATTNFPVYCRAVDGALYASGLYGSGIDSTVTLSSASGFTTRRHRDDAFFTIATAGAATDDTPIGISSTALNDLANRTPTGVRRIMARGNSRAVRANGENYAMGILHEAGVKPNVIGVDNIPISTTGLMTDVFFTGTPFTSGTVTVLQAMTVDGAKQDLGRYLYGSSSGTNPNGNGLYMAESSVVSMKATHAAGTAFTANTQALTVRAYFLGWPNGGGRVTASAVKGASQAVEGTQVATINGGSPINCRGIAQHTASWNSGSGYAYNASTKTVTIPGNITSSIDATMHIAVTTADGATVRACAAISSVTLNGGNTDIVVKRALGNAPNDTDLISIGEVKLTAIEYAFDGSEASDFRGLRLEATTGYGPCVAAVIGCWTTGDGFIICPAGCNGAGDTPQLAAFADDEKLLILRTLAPNVIMYQPAEQALQLADITNTVEYYQASCSAAIALCCDAQHGNWLDAALVQPMEDVWDEFRAIAPGLGCAFACGTNDTRVGSFLERNGAQFSADLQHPNAAGMDAWATAILDDLATVTEESVAGGGGVPAVFTGRYKRRRLIF